MQLIKSKFHKFKDGEISALCEIISNQSDNSKVIVAKIKNYTQEDIILLNDINQSLQEIDIKMSNFKTNVNASKSPLDPFWVRVFLCAIFIVLGHFVYQVRSPNEIQAHSQESFINEKKVLYSEFGTIDDLKKAEAKVKNNQDVLDNPDDNKIEINIRSYVRSSNVTLKKRIEEIDYSEVWMTKDWLLRKRQNHMLTPKEEEVLNQINKRINKAGGEDIELMNLTIISKAAEIDYRKTSIKGPLSVLTSALLYSAGIWLLLIIIKTQVVLVLEAAGNKPIYEYFQF
ncbi:MAG: hypothetical protein IPL46_25650 [Saprospiraceae bacterium]|nr:hypothetical protein [Saprospiraceae bacterium]